MHTALRPSLQISVARLLPAFAYPFQTAKLFIRAARQFTLAALTLVYLPALCASVFTLDLTSAAATASFNLVINFAAVVVACVALRHLEQITRFPSGNAGCRRCAHGPIAILSVPNF